MTKDLVIIVDDLVERFSAPEILKSLWHVALVRAGICESHGDTIGAENWYDMRRDIEFLVKKMEHNAIVQHKAANEGHLKRLQKENKST